MHAPLARITMFTVCGSHGSLLRCVALQQLCTEKGIRSDLDLRWMERGVARHGQEASELRYSVTYVAGQWRNWRLQLQQARAISGTGSVEKGEGLT